MENYSAEERIVWTCEAAGGNRAYRVETLDRMARSFRLAIYSDPSFNAAMYQETIEISVTREATSALSGVGQTASGELIRIRAFGETLAFDVSDSRYGPATGRCVRNTEMS